MRRSILASLAVSLGLLMSTKLLKGRAPTCALTHEILSLSTIVAIVVHAVALLGDKFLHPSIADITIPFVSSYKSGWMTLGIVSGWALILLGLSYYARRTIGAVRWRKLHRFTALAWLGGLVHSLGMGTDAGQLWFLAMIAIVAIPALALLVMRLSGAGRERPGRPAAGRSVDSGPSRAPPAPAGARGGAAAAATGTRPSGSQPGRVAAGRVAGVAQRARPVAVLSGSYRPGRVPDDEPRELATALRPAGPAAGQRDRVKAPAGDDHPRVVGVGVDGDPAARAGIAPALKAGRVERRAEQAGGGERVADRARAVVAAGLEGAVAAAPDVGQRRDRVAGGDHLGDRGRRAGRRLDHAAGVDPDTADDGGAAAAAAARACGGRLRLERVQACVEIVQLRGVRRARAELRRSAG